MPLYVPTQATSSKNLTFIQPTSAVIWTINHNFGYNPSVTVADYTGTVIIADVSYINSNNLSVAFDTPTSGTAYLV